MSDVFPRIPPRVPRGGNAFLCWFGRTSLGLFGWRVTGNLPDAPRIIIIGSPHTSNWDWVLTLLTAFSIGIRLHYLVKHTVFFWPLGMVLRATGGLPVNREAPGGVVEEVARQFTNSAGMVIAITPEGTRSRVEQWKTGFLRIAELAQLPIVQASWDYSTREVCLGPLVQQTGDYEADVQRIRAYYRQFSGRNPENQSS